MICNLELTITDMKIGMLTFKLSEKLQAFLPLPHSGDSCASLSYSGQ